MYELMLLGVKIQCSQNQIHANMLIMRTLDLDTLYIQL